MKRLILILMLAGVTVWTQGASYSEFYVNAAGGDNLNSGHTTEATATYGTTGGNWTNDTSVSVGTYYKSGLGAAATAVTNGAWASVFPDGTTVQTVFVGLVVTNDATTDTIQVSLVNKSGTKPASSTGGTSINVGGAWLGPNTNQNPSCTFPFGFVQNTMSNSFQLEPRVNFKAGKYSVTNSIAHASLGPIRWQGYTTTPGDKGKATIDGTWAGNSFILLNPTGGRNEFADLIFQGNGTASTAANGVEVATVGNVLFQRCVFANMRKSGLAFSASGVAIECEAYNCNMASGAGSAGFFNSVADAAYIRCFSHDNSSANGNGITAFDQASIINCITMSNKLAGISVNAGWVQIRGCDSYDNGGDGLNFTPSGSVAAVIENCNFVKNGGYGINSSGAGTRYGIIQNCGFGSGTVTNASGSYKTIPGIEVVDSVTYAADATPWVDPTNGNFRINLTAAKSAGRGFFTQSFVNPPTNTVGYPDIGSAQASDTNAVSSEHSHVFAQ